MTESGSAVAASRKAADPPANRLLGLLPPKDYAAAAAASSPCSAGATGSRSTALTSRIGFVYFIETGVGSLVNTMANGQAAEVGTIGNEGWSACRWCSATTGRRPASTSRFPAPA